MRQHITTILIALSVSAMTVHADALQPEPIGRPSLRDTVVSIQKRLDVIQKRESADRASIHALVPAINNAQASADCVDSATPVLQQTSMDDAGNVTTTWIVQDQDDPSFNRDEVDWVAMLDPECIS